MGLAEASLVEATLVALRVPLVVTEINTSGQGEIRTVLVSHEVSGIKHLTKLEK